MKPRKRRILCVLTVICMVFLTVAVSADYYGSDESGNSTPPDAIDDLTVSTEEVDAPKKQEGSPLTPDGNLSLIDDILQQYPYESDETTLEDKQFITVQSKNGNYFYLIIDRSGGAENVYFLNLVDEADLLSLLEGSTGARDGTGTHSHLYLR